MGHHKIVQIKLGPWEDEKGSFLDPVSSTQDLVALNASGLQGIAEYYGIDISHMAGNLGKVSGKSKLATAIMKAESSINSFSRPGRGYKESLKSGDVARFNRGWWRISIDKVIHIERLEFAHRGIVVAVAKPDPVGRIMLWDDRIAWYGVAPIDDDPKIGAAARPHHSRNPVHYFN